MAFGKWDLENGQVTEIIKFLIQCESNDEVVLDCDDVFAILKCDFDYVKKQYIFNRSVK